MINGYCKKWVKNAPQSQHENPNDIQITVTRKGRLLLFTAGQENLIKESVIYYAKNHNALSQQSLICLVDHLLNQSDNDSEFEHNFKVTKGWVEGFMSRNPELKLLPVQTIEATRSNSITANAISEHIARH